MMEDRKERMLYMIQRLRSEMLYDDHSDWTFIVYDSKVCVRDVIREPIRPE
jgi:hypothetical protein